VREESRQLLEKAGRALHAAEVLLHAGDAEFAAGRAYYAMLYVAQALLRQKGLPCRKHAAVHAAFGQHFAKTGLLDPKFHRWLLDAFDKRLLGDYGFEADVSPGDAAAIVDQAREFLQAGRGYLRAAF